MKLLLDLHNADLLWYSLQDSTSTNNPSTAQMIGLRHAHLSHVDETSTDCFELVLSIICDDETKALMLSCDRYFMTLASLIFNVFPLSFTISLESFRLSLVAGNKRFSYFLRRQCQMCYRNRFIAQYLDSEVNCDVRSLWILLDWCRLIHQHPIIEEDYLPFTLAKRIWCRAYLPQTPEGPVIHCLDCFDASCASFFSIEQSDE